MWYETLLPKILNMSLTGGIVIALLLPVQLILKKSPRILSYVLWGVALFRLLCPVSFSAEFSALNFLDVPVTEEHTIEYIPTHIVSEAFPQVDFLLDPASDAVNSALPQGWEQVDEKPLSNWALGGTVIWIAGMAIVLISSLISLGKLRKRLADAQLLRDNIYISGHLDTPLVMGVFRPRIYLPAMLTQNERDYVLLHEQYHIKRRDHIVKLFSFAALCLHWFNPLAWIAFRLADRDMEMSCDEEVIKHMTQDMRCDYSQSLLRLASGRRGAAVGLLSFCEGDPKSRVKNILRWKSPRLHTWLICGGACVLVFLSLLADPVMGKQYQTPEPFTGQLHLQLPEGYDYMLLDDPTFAGDERNIIIHYANTSYPVSSGCVSLDFSPAPEMTAWYDFEQLRKDGSSISCFSKQEDGSWCGLLYRVPDWGTIEIRAHNASHWDAVGREFFYNIADVITVTEPQQRAYVDLGQTRYVTAATEELDRYILYTLQGNICVSVSGAEKTCVISLHERYTDRLVDSFCVSQQDYWRFEGLSGLKEYYLTVSGGDAAEITIFSEEREKGG